MAHCIGDNPCSRGVLGVQVNQDYDPATDFKSMQAYRWESETQQKTGDLRIDNPLRDTRIRTAVARQLSDKGFVQSTDDAPTFLVRYQYTLRQKIESDGAGGGIGFGIGSFGRSGGVAIGTGNNIREYDEGSLTIDFVDATSQTLSGGAPAPSGSGSTKTRRKPAGTSTRWWKRSWHSFHPRRKGKHETQPTAHQPHGGPLSLFFDKRDRDLLKIVNGVLSRSTPAIIRKKGLFPWFHPHGIKELAETRGLRIAYAVIHLLESLEAGDLEDRLNALRSLRDEVLHASAGSLPKNAARVLLSIMKDLIRAHGNEIEQLKLAHDFRRVARGKPSIVRKMLGATTCWRCLRPGINWPSTITCMTSTPRVANPPPT